jgi:hypothetical protein
MALKDDEEGGYFAVDVAGEDPVLVAFAHSAAPMATIVVGRSPRAAANLWMKQVAYFM